MGQGQRELVFRGQGRRGSKGGGLAHDCRFAGAGQEVSAIVHVTAKKV